MWLGQTDHSYWRARSLSFYSGITETVHGMAWCYNILTKTHSSETGLHKIYTIPDGIPLKKSVHTARAHLIEMVLEYGAIDLVHNDAIPQDRKNQAIVKFIQTTILVSSFLHIIQWTVSVCQFMTSKRSYNICQRYFKNLNTDTYHKNCIFYKLRNLPIYHYALLSAKTRYFKDYLCRIAQNGQIKWQQSIKKRTLWMLEVVPWNVCNDLLKVAYAINSKSLHITNLIVAG